MVTTTGNSPLTLSRLLDPEILANPYLLYKKLRAGSASPEHAANDNRRIA
jgi:hypothetical protein